MTAVISTGIIDRRVIGMFPADLGLPPDPLFRQNPERWEFVDITAIEKRYVISLATGLFVSTGGGGGGGGAWGGIGGTLSAQTDLNTALLAKLNNAIGWDPSVNTTPALVSGTPLSGAYAGINAVVNTHAGTTTLGTAIDGYATTKFGDVWIYGFGGSSVWNVFSVIPPMATTDLTDAAVLNQQVTNAQTGTTYSLALTDAGKNIDMNNASANTLTIQTNANIAFPIGTVINVTQVGAGVTTISPSSGVTFTKPSARSFAISAQTETALLYKTGTDTWRVYCN